MFARCTICFDGLGERNPPLSTGCGHLYCAHCAGRHFARRALCATCRSGPYNLDQLVKLFPNYDNESDSASLRGRDSVPAATTSQHQDASAGASSQPESPTRGIVQTITARMLDLLSTGRHGSQRGPPPPPPAIPATSPRHGQHHHVRSTSDALTPATRMRRGTTDSGAMSRHATPMSRRESTDDLRPLFEPPPGTSMTVDHSLA